MGQVHTVPTNSSVDILDLPTELICSVLRLLHYKDILRCKQTCKYFMNVVNSDESLRYLIKLGLNGLIDSHEPHHSMTINDRIRLLDKYQGAWNSSAFDICENLSQGSKKRKYLPRKQVHQWNAALYISDDLTYTVHVVQLPSKLRGITERTIISHKLDFCVRACAMDISHNVLALAELLDDEIRVHLRTLYTCEVDPKLPISEFTCPVLASPCELELCSVYLVLWTHEGREEHPTALRVWNWELGTLILEIHDHNICFSFLTDHHIILSGGNILGLHVVDLRSLTGEERNLATLNYTYCLLFPKLKDGLYETELMINSKPEYSPIPNTKPITSPSPLQRVPFYTDPSHRIIIVTVYSLKHDGHEYSPKMFVIPSDTFLSYLDEAQHIPSKRTISWEQWGPQGTRFYSSMYTDAGEVYYGYRAHYGLRLVEYGDEKSNPCIDILDFNQRKREHGAAAQKYDGTTLVTYPSVLDTGRSPFAEVVTTHLPYRHRKVFLDTPFDNMVRPIMYMTEDALFFEFSNLGRRSEGKHYALYV
ncbi:hypothetical protein QCA50_015096 [Cerrena zonata]|uniref:F-box domain-containing protein n=1 Tax=Cerrena zonata TaxID=2478898 RepID=A0AAW0FQ96_9APHY